jgi:hypothetical protein
MSMRARTWRQKTSLPTKPAARVQSEAFAIDVDLKPFPGPAPAGSRPLGRLRSGLRRRGRLDRVEFRRAAKQNFHSAVRAIDPQPRVLRFKLHMSVTHDASAGNQVGLACFHKASQASYLRIPLDATLKLSLLVPARIDTATGARLSPTAALPPWQRCSIDPTRNPTGNALRLSPAALRACPDTQEPREH